MTKKTWHEQLKRRFDYNIRRVENLIEASKEVKGNNCKGDVLRAAVVLLHATTEDVLRTCQYHMLLNSRDEKALENVALDYDDKGSPIMRFSLGQVRKHLERQNSIASFIEKRILKHFNSKSYNNAKDLEIAAQNIDVVKETSGRLAKEIEPMMVRRHQIVHQSDRRPLRGDTHGKLVDIQSSDVLAWINSVKPFVAAVLETAATIKERDPNAD